MSDLRFPVSCSTGHVDARADGPQTLPNLIIGVVIDLGPQQLACADRSVYGAAPDGAPTLEAAQPVVALASQWTRSPRALPIAAQAWTGFGNHITEAATATSPTRYDGSVSAPTRHASAYMPGGPALSVRFAVHETGRNLDTGRNFGRHVRSLRRARGMTQEVLAERSGLSPDTIRRLEHGSFSPSLDTLRKLCGGLDLMLSTLFESYELGSRNETRELIDLLAARGTRELVLATRVLRALFEELDGIAAQAVDDDDDDDETDDET